MVFIVTSKDVERANLDQSDIGRWAFIVQGCWQLFDSEQAAQMAHNVVFGGLR